jgi:mRNA-degrading endonuclease RelE of RelBE toxin-antitoxin system
MPYQIEFAASVESQLEALGAHERTSTLAAIEDQLLHQPLVETRNRKLLRPNPLAPWELRVGPVRVFYEVKPTGAGQRERQDLLGIVYVLAVGRKEGNVLRIGGEKVQL